ncbi:MAG TPA: alpha/beta hydrolase [Phototrophicaceae bacterium]|nr:alpha/beta hydrolase [Phototrophicaceae bacterium]
MADTKLPHSWVRGYYKRGAGGVHNTQVAYYRMSDLVNRGFIAANDGRGFLMDRGLVDFAWQLIWPEDFDTPDDMLEQRLADAEGFAIFIHGWTGNHTIWEDLPGLVVKTNRRLVALAVDHNGFGESLFVDKTPDLNACCPPAAMQSIEKWVEVLKLRRQPGNPTPKVINFVGHSMGGAALFYLNPIFWRMGEETRYAIAPALLLNDSMHRAFYTTMGVGIGLVNRIKLFEPIEQIIKPSMIETLCGGSDEFVKNTHNKQYAETPRGIISATFQAMGLLNNWEIARKWDLFRVLLGHKDALVGLLPMMDLLSSLEMPAGNIRVVAGSHYLFSVGRETAFQHAQNRELAVDDIVNLHRQAYNAQKTGQGGSRGFG